MKIETIKNIPEWATCYIMYGDDSGLNATDRREIDYFLDRLRRNGFRLIAPIEGTGNEFCLNPAFSSSCSVEDWTAEVLI